MTMTKQLLVDDFILGPFLYLPVAYIFKRCITAASEPPGDAEGPRSVLELSRRAMETYVEDVVEHDLLKTYWSLWIPMQLLVYHLIPSHFRVLCGPGELLVVLLALDNILFHQRRKIIDEQDGALLLQEGPYNSATLDKTILHHHRGGTVLPAASPASLNILLPFAIE